MLPISSKDNQYLKLARSLHQKKGRSVSGCFLVEGIRLAEEAVACALSIRAAFIGEEPDRRIMDLAASLEAQGLPVYTLAPGLLSGISATEHCQGIVLIAALPADKPMSAGGHCYALCDRVADPGNLGTIIRSAYAAEVSGLILTPGCADPYNPKSVRAAMGALFRLPIFSAPSDEMAYQKAGVLGLAIYTAVADGQDIRDMGPALADPHLWVLGSEAKGVSAFWRERAKMSARIPMRQGAESLNVAAAAAVLFYQSFFSNYVK